VSSDRRHGFTRREALAAAAAVPLLGLAGCGEIRAGPPLSRLGVPLVRVRLGAPRPKAELRLPAGGWEIVGEAGRAYSLRQPTTLQVPLGPGALGIALGGRDTGATRLRVRVSESFGLDGGTYAGDLIVQREGAGLLLVGELDLETYVAGVIPNECALAAPPATHRAQAVASRTYAYVALDAPGAATAPWHLKDTQSSQVYRGLSIPAGFGASPADMRQRCSETRGVVLTWRDRPLTTYFASTCGGHTTEPTTSHLKADAAAAPLQGVRCAYCTTSSRYRWTKRVSDADLVVGMASRKLPIAEPLEAIEVTELGRGGWARQLVIVAGPNRHRRTVSGPDFRSAAALDSHHILAIRRIEGGFEIDGAGWGHGVGMCQWGSYEMGKRGFSETDILRTYYPGVAFSRLY
jgi:stage II sporulation protein D